MVSRKSLLVAAAVAMAFVVGAPTASAFSDNHVVGDFNCWQLGVNYDDWARSVDIYSGDTLHFLYLSADHNVVKVDEDSYNECDATNNLGTWNTGDDYVQVSDPGKHFFICGMGNHCTRGMKVAVDVA